jgi:hypothetical protein
MTGNTCRSITSQDPRELFAANKDISACPALHDEVEFVQGLLYLFYEAWPKESKNSSESVLKWNRKKQDTVSL